MIEIIIYCIFCYLAELGVQLTKGKFAWGSYLLAPIMFPLELGASIRREIDLFSPNMEKLPTFRDAKDNDIIVFIPTAEQMIGWLRKEMKLAISVDYNIQDNKAVWFYSIYSFAYSNPFNEPEDATLAAIDAALDYLIENKK